MATLADGGREKPSSDLLRGWARAARPGRVVAPLAMVGARGQRGNRRAPGSPQAVSYRSTVQTVQSSAGLGALGIGTALVVTAQAMKPASVALWLRETQARV
jgi:hypothetical protein